MQAKLSDVEMEKVYVVQKYGLNLNYSIHDGHDNCLFISILLHIVKI